MADWVTRSSAMLGSWQCRCYSFFRAQGMEHFGIMPRTFNVWQDAGQLRIWLLAKGWT